MSAASGTLLAARVAVERAPGDAIAWMVLADAELDAGDVARGAHAAERALRLSPGHPEGLARLGRAQWMGGRHADAAASLRQAVHASPDHPGFVLWLGHVLEDVGEGEAANAAYGRAHALAPQIASIAGYLLGWRRKLCDWRGLDALSAQVVAAVRNGEPAIEPFALLSEDVPGIDQLRCARLAAARVAAQVRPLPARAMGVGAPLRLGFLSNGFGAHPTGLLTVAFFEALASCDDSRVEAHLFALGPDDGSLIRRRLAAATRLHEVGGQAHAAVAATVRDAEIDILFDLRGWGGGGAPAVLAMRPAPLQVNWLAYPGTSGAPWIDYVIGDDFVLPASLHGDFSEAVAWLPRCFQPSDTRRRLEAPPTRADCGLPVAGTVFCAFNNSYKMNPASFGRALAVLRGVPASCLWLLSGPGDGDGRLRSSAAAAGIDPQRLVFMPKQPHAAYLARLRLADLFLDCSPYNAHTTASDALWAGCPVLTRPGTTFASRVAGSLNHHLGLDALNAAHDDAFIAIATRLGNDPAALAALRGQLRDAAAAPGLFSMDAFARDFATLAHRMAARARAGLAPAALAD